MDDETQVETDHHADGEAETQIADQTTDNALPEDPLALKQTAEQLQLQLLEERREARKLKRENERLGQDVKAQSTKADYWAREAQRQQARGPAAESTNGKPNGKPVEKALSLEEALEGIPLADYVADDNGTAKLAKLLKEKCKFATMDEVRDFARQQVQEERRLNAEYREVGQRYPGLVEDEKFQSRAQQIFEDLSVEKPHLSDSERFELAAARAEKELGPVKKKADDSANRERLRTAQGGPRSSGNPDGGIVRGKITPELQKMARRTAGMDLDPTVLQKVADRVEAAKRQASRAS